jgi:hypothetical protein
MTSTRKLILVGLSCAVFGLLVVLRLFCHRPAMVIGVQGDLLGESISNALGRHSPSGECHQAADDRWSCSIIIEPDPGSGGGPVSYKAEVDGEGCWHARQVDAPPQRADLTGCINVLDVLL